MERTVHEVVRDYPEVLGAWRGEGMDVAALGGRRLDDLDGGEEIAATAVAAAAWRPPAPRPPSSEGRGPP